MKSIHICLIAGRFLTAFLPLTTTLHAAATIQFSATTYSVAEYAGAVTLIVQRTDAVDTVVSVSYASTNLSATPDLDYVNATGTLQFDAGVTNQSLVFTILNDGLVEPAETFQVMLSNPTGGAVLGIRSTATVRINDNDRGIQPELASYYVNEDVGAITVRILRRDDGNSPVTVEYATTNLTAVAGQDYLDVGGTLTFAPGDTFKRVTIPILNDAARESSETFRITLRNPSGGAVLGTNPSAIVTITDADEAVQFQAASFSVGEDVGFARVAVTRGESASAATVDVTSTDGTAVAGQDYTGVTNTLQFAPGERLKYVDVPVLNDGIKESSETFRIVLSNPTGEAVLGPTRTVTVTILDNDPGVGFERSSYGVWEKLPRLKVHVVRGNDGWLGPFTVDYQTVDGAARAGVDYAAASGTLAFGENETVKDIPLALLRDPTPASTKSFTVTLSHLTGQISLGRSTVSITIVDASQGNACLAQPPVRGSVWKDDGLIRVSWPELAVVSRAASVAGPWEELGTMDSPLFSAPQLPAGFYQLRSPRSARVYVPSSYDGQAALPLVVVLHGYGGSGAGYVDYFRMEPLAEARRFLVCYPDGTFDQQNARFWNATDACCNFYGADVDDSAYLRGLILELARQYPVDRKRIYVTGHSNGGFMSYRMACDHADLIAGIASLAGMTFLDPNASQPSQPVSVLHVHGSADEVVPYAGGALIGLPVAAFFPEAVQTVQSWAHFNGCQGPISDAHPTMDLDLNVAGLDTVVLRYASHPLGGAVELWTINGGRHSPTLFSGTKSSEYSARVIDWLLAHPKP
jgi:polyhydroxybutyrate depolymerase